MTSQAWYTSQELAGLPGLPSTDRGIRNLAKAESWECRRREGTKATEFHLGSLPPQTIAALAQKMPEGDAAKAGRAVAKLAEASKKVSEAERLAGSRKLIAMPAKQRRKAEAKAMIIQAREQHCAPFAAVKQLTKAEVAFCEAYNRRQVDLPEWVYENVGHISFQSVRRWKEKGSKAGVAALADNYHNERAHKVDGNPQMAEFLQAVLFAKPHLQKKARELRKQLGIYAQKNGLSWDVPSESAIRRWVSLWITQNKAAFTFVTSPKEYQDKYRNAVEKTYPWMTAPNDVWEFDSTPADAMLQEGRHSIIAVIDCYTRRVRLLVSPTSTSEGICLLLRKTLLSWGVINENGLARTDNGSDYVSTRTTAVFSHLGIEVSRANPYSGWEKPFIERFFRTLSHGLVELLPGYIGHNVADREVIEARMEFAKRLEQKRLPEDEREGFELRMTRPELQELLDNWVDAYYHNQSHGGAGMDGMSPNEKYRASRYQPRLINDASALDLLLNHAGEATVLKGFVKSGLRYSAPELMDHSWKGQRVSVYLDPTDVGRAYLFRVGDWSQRIEAVDTDMIGRDISPAEYRQKKKADMQALRAYRREAKRLIQHFGIDDMHQNTVDHYAALAQKIASLPQGSQEHNNAAIEALGQAIESGKTSPRYSEEEIKRLEQTRVEIEKKSEQLANQRGLQIRNEHDKAVWLAEQSLVRELTHKEQSFLANYKKQNPFGAERVESIMARRKKA